MLPSIDVPSAVRYTANCCHYISPIKPKVTPANIFLLITAVLLVISLGVYQKLSRGDEK